MFWDLFFAVFESSVMKELLSFHVATLYFQERAVQHPPHFLFVLPFHSGFPIIQTSHTHQRADN